MNFVEPIRNKKDINRMKRKLEKQNKRNEFLFTFGINVGFRISDLLKLKVGDIRDKDYIDIRERKTRKTKRFPINNILKYDIEAYTFNKPDNEYLFKSRKGINKPISTVQAYNILNGAAKELGIENVGTHTLRKTFGYWHYQQFKDVAMLQEIFNHSSPSTTLRYIGINQDLIDQSIQSFYL